MTLHARNTNGASLEDCHTNFFALTELSGIKWRKWIWGGCPGGVGVGGEPFDDPVLSSYSRCLADDVLCVWRRVATPMQQSQPPGAQPDLAAAPPPPPPPPPLSLSCAKELWIFWYGEEPDLGGLVAPELIASDSEQGSWESGLSYECRSLLFKALHNLIERCLLSRDFIRLGKWFVQPYDGDEEDIAKSCQHFSFSFAFFVHGESAVCASVDVRQHPPVRRLSRLRTDSQNTKVILAPFGLAGTLINQNSTNCNGNTTSNDPVAARLLEAWKHFYPLPSNGTEPATVDVAVGGTRMRYPSRYVLLTDVDDTEPSVSSSTQSKTTQHLPPRLSAVFSHRTITELGIGQQEIDSTNTDTSVDIKPVREWDFVDPTRRTTCSCLKCVNNLTEHGTPGGASPGSCGAMSPLPPTSAGGGPASCGTIPVHSSSPQQPPNPPTTPRTSVPPILLPHTPAPTPPPIHPPATPRNQTSVESPQECLKRPILSLQEPEIDPLEEERSLDLLYDYSTLHAWLNHPVKKFKQEEGCAIAVGPNGEIGAHHWVGWEEPTPWRKGEDLYAGHNHTKMAPIEPQPYNGPLLPFIKTEIKQEPNQDDGNKENKNLFTSDGLQPSYKDLEQIFDNSDDTSGDETLQVHTPPDSNKSLTGCTGDDGNGNTVLNNISGNVTRTNNRTYAVRPEELCKMFPTPPSLEHNPQPSPGAFTLTEPDQPSLQLRCGSPPDEPIEDWSYVFKPPVICKYVGSSKYAALSGLSNTVPPSNCIYRPSWQHQSPTPETRAPPRPPAPRTPHHLANLQSVGTISQPASVGGVSGVGSAPPPPIIATPSPASSIPPSPPVCALLLNLLLADTALNIFRDHNFDSCTMCVCNAGPKVVGNIRGADSGVYLYSGGSPASPDSNLDIPSPIPALGSNGLLEEEPIRCSCGFSAVVNRRLAHRAGLFYEDEMEITGIADDPAQYKKDGGVFCDSNKSSLIKALLIELVKEQCGITYNTTSILHLAATEAAENTTREPQIHLLEYTDCGEAAALALEAAAGRAAPAVHSWPFLRVPAPTCGRDVVRVMRRLQPLLQDAILKKCSTKMWNAVARPLTWRQFHRLAGRGTEDLCEPQPVPPLLVGHDRDWVSLSPHAIHLWDKLLLEPYSYSRDVGYIALVPDNVALIPKVRTFFRDLSTTYEQCRLGRHAPVARISKDGLLRVPRSARTEPLDEWFNSLPDNTLSEILKLYAQTCRGVLGPALSNVQLDRSLLDGDNSNGTRPPPPATPTERPAPSPMAPPSTPDHPATPTAQHSDLEAENTNANANSNAHSGSNVSENTSNEEDEGSAPCIVVYLIEPCLSEDRRTTCLAMLRSAAYLLQNLPDNIRSNIAVQMISAESISDIGSAGAGMGTIGGRTVRRSSHLRSLALSVFSQCRRQLVHTSNIKSLTGFGTAANADLFLKNKDEKNKMPYRLYVPPYVLAPSRPLKDIAETFGRAAPEPCTVLYISYCLSADQSWLLASATDGRGELLDTCTINIDVPGRSRRRRAPPARRFGLTKLMDFILGVMSQSVQPWRLVVGRIGRIGHGELKGWSWLLSRKNLLKASTQLREVCNSCGLMYPGGAPCILSACLVSTEPDSALRLMADQFTPDERFSQAAVASQLSTPQDVTCTHILVFPTSATTQSSQTAFQDQHINGPDLGDDELFSALNDDMTDGIDGMNDFSDIFNGWPSGIQSPNSSPKREGDEASRPGSPGRPTAAHGRHTPLSEDGNHRCGVGGGWEEVGALLQQPLALGYLVSTAPLGRMPHWWWAACPHAANACPVFLKNALHLHSQTVQQTSDDLLQQPPSSLPQHPLDSQFTTDVLRYVLEGYNALSWLALDCNSQDRISCLPSHVQVLMQLYHLTSNLV